VPKIEFCDLKNPRNAICKEKYHSHFFIIVISKWISGLKGVILAQ